MAGLGGFVTIFVVAATMGFSITQRRRELALLRLAGATPLQVRRMLLSEAAAVSILASLAAAAAALPVADVMLAFLRHLGVAPRALSAHLQAWPLVIASGIGLVVALAGAWAPARRSRRIRPAEALRQAAVEQRPMTKTRWAAGVTCLAGGTAMLVVAPQVSGNAGLAPAGFAGLVLITGIALLGPALARPLTGLVGLPLTRGPLARVSGPGAEVAREQLRAQPRRTASLAAPVLLLVGIAGSLLALAHTTQAAAAADLRRQVTASLIAETTATPPGLATPVIAAIAATPGVASAAAPIPIDVYVPTRARLEDVQADGTGPAVTSGAGPLRYLVTRGSLSALTGQAVAVSNQEAAILGWQPGRQVRAWLGDGTAVRLRVIATYDAGLSGPALLLPRALVETHIPPGTATTAYIQLKRHASLPAVTAALRRSLAGTGTTLRARAQYLQQAPQSAAAGENIGLTAMLTVALLYVAIAVVNTLVMAGRERVRELAQYRLAGATRAQALAVPAWEATIIAVVGIILGLAVTAITAITVPIALRHLGSDAATAVPWQILLAIVGGSAVLVLVPSLAVGTVALRPRPLDGLMIPE